MRFLNHKKTIFILSVNFSVVSGGSALVAASLIAGSSSLTPALALLFGSGATLAIGNMAAVNMCIGKCSLNLWFHIYLISYYI